MSKKARQIADSEYPAPPGDHPSTISVWARDRNALMDEIDEAVAPLISALADLVERVDINGGLGPYKSGPIDVMSIARKALKQWRER